MSKKCLLYFFVLFSHLLPAIRTSAQYTYHCGGFLLHLHGTSACVDAQDPDYEPTGITLAAWVRPETKNAKNMALVYRMFDAHQQIWTTVQYGIVINSLGQFMFQAMIDTSASHLNAVVTEYNTRGEPDSLSSGIAADSGKYYHLAVTLDPDSHICNFYVNGTVAATKTMKGALHWSHDNLNPSNTGSQNELDASVGAKTYYIFNGQVATSMYFNGYIDDVVESSSVLTKSQLDIIAAGNDVQDAPSLMNYHFSEGTGVATASNPGVIYNTDSYGNLGILKGDYAWVNCTAALPTAVAGPDQLIVMPKDQTLLNGSPSHPASTSGSIVSYSWQQTAGPAPASILSPQNSITLVYALKVGVYTFQLTVTDNQGNTAASTVKITVQRAWADRLDSLALVDFYNNTNGPNWTTKWILTQPVMTWNGVNITFDTGRVTTLLLQNNNLSDSIPATILNLTDLIALNVSKNKLTFKGMETLAQRFGNFAVYSPQDSIVLDVNKGVYNAQAAGGTLTNNTYYWYKNTLLDATISGNSEHIFTGGSSYYAAVSNSIAKQLIIVSKMVKTDTIPVVQVYDPYPTMITSDGKLNAVLSDAILSQHPAIGAATDGNTKLLLIAKTDKTLQFNIDDIKNGQLGSLQDAGNHYINPANPTSVTVQSVNGYVVAVFSAPDGYGGNISLSGRLSIVKYNIAASSQVNYVPLNLYTPPLVLVHGMWSDPSVWNKGFFLSSLSAAGYIYSQLPGIPTSVFMADYSENICKGCSSSTFDPSNEAGIAGRDAIRKSIADGLASYRKENIAITQVDVVGHSLGGLMTRSLSQQQPSFLKPENYYKGYVHKLITLGTPHRGSPLGPELWNNQYNLIPIPNLQTVGGPPVILVTVKDILSWAKQPIGLCHKDFGKDSPGIQHLSATLPFHAFAITGRYFQSNKSTPAYIALTALLYLTTHKGFDNIFKDTCKFVPFSDLVVELNSQGGGISNTKNFPGVYHLAIIPGDASETNSINVQNYVIGLLQSNDASIFAQGFPAPSSIPSDCIDGTNRVNTSSPVNMQAARVIDPVQKRTVSSDNFIQIISPLTNTHYQQNTNTAIVLQYRVNGNLKPTNSLFMIEGVGWFSGSTTAPYSTSITLPSNTSLGTHKLVALVYDSLAQQSYADTSSILISTFVTLDSMQAYPAAFQFDSIGRNGSVYLQGFYADGSSANISESSAGTLYTIQHGGIVSVNANGAMTAIMPGSDTLLISNNGHSIKIPLVVDATFLQRQMYANQINFPVIGNLSVTNSYLSLTASAVSGDDITYTVVSGNATVSNDVVVIKGPGPVTIKAADAGNAYFSPAQDKYQTFCVNPSQPYSLIGDTVTCSGQKNYHVAANAGTSYNWQVSEGGNVASNDSTATINWKTAGKHILSVIPNASGCYGPQLQATITVILPGQNFITPADSVRICDNIKAQLRTTDSTGPIQWYLNGAPISNATTRSVMAAVPGIYTVQSIDTNGCISNSDSSIVFIRNLSKPSLIPGDTTSLCNGAQLTMSVTDSAGAIQWYHNNNAIAGALNRTYITSQTGLYAVKITDTIGCSAISNTAIIKADTISAPLIAASDTASCKGSLLLTSNVAAGNQWYYDSSLIAGATSQEYTVSKAGNYYVMVSSLSRCTTSSMIYSAHPLTSPPIPNIIFSGGLLKSSVDTGNHWFFNGLLLPGATANSYLPADSGMYAVQVTINGCTSQLSVPYHFVVSATSPIVQVFPNPAHSQITILNRSKNPYNIQLFDARGNIVLSMEHSKGAQQINMTSFATGMYVVLVTDEVSGIEIRKKILRL